MMPPNLVVFNLSAKIILFIFVVLKINLNFPVFNKGNCGPGTYLDNVTADCLPCQKGFYQNQSLQTDCMMCPVNTSTRNTGSSSQDDCTSKPLFLFISNIIEFIKNKNIFSCWVQGFFLITALVFESKSVICKLFL